MTEQTSFERQALPHLSAAYTLAYWLLRNRADAEDAVQEAYLRAYKAHGTLKADDIKPWLLTIVRNVAYRALSRRQRGSNVISFDEALPGGGLDGAGGGNAASMTCPLPSPEDLLIGHGEQALVARALGELPPVFREVIVLREMDGCSYREIADITGVPMGTVMSRLSRARAELKTILTGLIDKDDKNAM